MCSDPIAKVFSTSPVTRLICRSINGLLQVENEAEGMRIRAVISLQEALNES
jgi:hypothetical protein